MHKSILLIAAISFLTLTGCQRINPEDITVIDGIKLGMSNAKFSSQLDSLHIEEKTLYTNPFLENSDQIEASKVSAHLTNMFNSNTISGDKIQHVGVYYPIQEQGNGNIIGTSVLFVHTTAAMLIDAYGIRDVTEQTGIQAVDQNIPESQPNDIVSLLTSKFGKPAEVTRDPNQKLRVFKYGKVEDYETDDKNFGKTYKWHTKCLDIEFFDGITSREQIFNTSTHTYSLFTDDTQYKVDRDNGEIACKRFAYLKYMLNEETIKKMGLDKINL